jgi:microsomal dipeptidase-like Zn-dependent dipeptidase
VLRFIADISNFLILKVVCKFNAMKIYLISLLTLLLALNNTQLWSQTDKELAEAADLFHRKHFTIDTHNDTALHLNNPNRGHSVTKGQVTFPMMREGGLDAAFFAIFIGQGPRSDEGHKSAKENAEGELVNFLKYVSLQDNVRVAHSADDLLLNKSQGYLSVVPALENGYPLGKDLGLLNHFYNLGVRAITLCHNKNNEICDASMDTTSEHGGLSGFGESVVKEMNKMGIAIDVSHASVETLKDVLALSTKPVIATHSGVWSIKHHNRNLRDEEIAAIAEKGGLIQIATGRFFLSDRPKEEVAVKDIADHIDYAVKIAGIEHVGIGTDFDGGGGVVGLENVSKMKNITIELMRRGYTEYQLSRFWGENLLDFLRKIQK